MIRIMTVGVDRQLTTRLERAMSSWPDVQLQPWPSSVTGVGVVEAIASRHPDLIVLGPELDEEIAFEVAEKLERLAPASTVVIVTPPGKDTWRRALEAGIRAVIDPKAGQDELYDALDAALAAAQRRRSIAARDGGHKVIVVVSPKGGVGKTVVSTNLALALAMQTEEQVALVDLDLSFGDVSHVLMLTPEHTMADAVDALPDLDITTLKVFLAKHPSGIYALCAPDDPTSIDRISAEDASAVVDLLAAEFPYTVVDTAGGFGEHAFAVMEHATDLVIVSEMDVPSVHNARKAAHLANLLGITEPRRRFVLNRSNSRVGLQVSEVASAAGLHIDVELPSSRYIPLSVNEGKPMLLTRPRSPFSRRILTLAEQIMDNRRPAAEEAE